jgi:hypothetical protein
MSTENIFLLNNLVAASSVLIVAYIVFNCIILTLASKLQDCKEVKR